jgi:hypothetical protein
MAEPFSLSGWMQNLAGKWLNESEPVVHKKLSPQQQSHQQEIENSLLVLTAAVIRCDRNFDHNTEQTVLLFFDRQFGASRKVYRLNTIQQHLEMGTEPFTKIACTPTQTTHHRPFPSPLARIPLSSGACRSIRTSQRTALPQTHSRLFWHRVKMFSPTSKIAFRRTIAPTPRSASAPRPRSSKPLPPIANWR